MESEVLNTFRMFLTMAVLQGKTIFTIDELYALELKLREAANE